MWHQITSKLWEAQGGQTYYWEPVRNAKHDLMEQQNHGNMNMNSITWILCDQVYYKSLIPRQ